jgi:hypothetical protein
MEKNQISWNKGKTGVYSIETLKKMSESAKGRKVSIEVKEKISKKVKENKKLKERKGIKNPNYKGAKDCLFSYHSKRLDIDECREDNFEKIQVRCKYCNKWFNPTQVEIDNRVNQLKLGKTGCNFYCSKECKDLCSDHYQVLWPKNFKPYANINRKSEVNSIIRKLVFERDNWECQKCGKTNSLECHHIDPVKREPLFSNDIDSCITICKDCHKEIHSRNDDCSYSNLKSIC